MAHLQSFLLSLNRSYCLPLAICRPVVAAKTLSLASSLMHSIFHHHKTVPHRSVASMATKPSTAAQAGNPAKIAADPKRIIIACDGTWDDDNYGMEKKDILPWTKETATPPSNVTRICRSILPFDHAAQKQQIVYYQAGIGSEHTLKDKLWGGLTGFGISEHVREAYAFLCHNYVENKEEPEKSDEIIIVGFSRGAFTARTISSMISDLGLLSMKGMDYFFPIFKDWENQIVPGYVSPFEEPFPKGSYPDLNDKPKFGDAYTDFLVKVKAVSRHVFYGILTQCRKDISSKGMFLSNVWGSGILLVKREISGAGCMSADDPRCSWNSLDRNITTPSSYGVHLRRHHGSSQRPTCVPSLGLRRASPSLQSHHLGDAGGPHRPRSEAVLVPRCPCKHWRWLSGRNDARYYLGLDDLANDRRGHY